jgi:hypothetical protein
MANKKPYNDNFADLVARLNAMSNQTPEQERSALMEAAKSEPRVLDEKDVSLADIAKLAGIKEYIEPVKHSKAAKRMVESIVAEPKVESSIAKAIKESDADDSISTQIKKTVTEESKRLDKIAELETQLAELKMAEKEDATLDEKSFREAFINDVSMYAKDADANELVELYNKFSENEVEMNENNFIIKTPETAEVIADAESKEVEAGAEVVQEKPEAEERLVDLDKEVLPDPDGMVDVETPAVEDGGEEVEVEVAADVENSPTPQSDKFTNDLDPEPKK